MTELEVKNYTNFHLCIEVASHKILLLLIDRENSKPIALEEIETNSKSIIDLVNHSEICSKSSPYTVSCCVINSFFTLLPVSIFNEEKKDNYLNFNISETEELKVIHSQIQGQEIINCFGVEPNLHQNLVKVFPQLTFTHIGTVLASSLSNGLHVNFSSKNEMDIVYKTESLLIFYNRYIIENSEESLYYLSLACEKLDLNIKTSRIGLSGFVDKKGEIVSFWTQFIPEENLIFNEIEATQLNAISTHRFFALHKQFQCV